MRKILKQLANKLPVQLLRSWYVRQKAIDVLFDWRQVLSHEFEGEMWKDRVDRIQQPDSGAPHVLIATTTGAQTAALQFDALLAIALTLRDVRVSFVLCDSALSACSVDQYDWHPNLRRFANGDGSRAVCSACHSIGLGYFEPLALPIKRLGEFLEPNDYLEANRRTSDLTAETCADMRIDSCAVGEHAMAGALRFLARSDLKLIPDADSLLDAFLVVDTYRCALNNDCLQV